VKQDAEEESEGKRKSKRKRIGVWV
jgi:hypothetical protein